MSKLRMIDDKVNVAVMLGYFISPDEYTRINESQKVEVGEQFVMTPIIHPHYQVQSRLPYKGKFGVVRDLKYRIFQNEPNPKAPHLDDPETYMTGFEMMSPDQYFLGKRMDMDLFVNPNQRLRSFAPKTALIYLYEPEVRTKLSAHAISSNDRLLRICLFMSPSVSLAEQLYIAGVRKERKPQKEKIPDKTGSLTLERCV